MITWKPENVATVDTWMLAMVLSKGHERILIGTDYEIKEVLSKKKTVQLFYDKIRPFGTFLIEFDDDRLNGKWRNALLCLKEAQRVSTLEEWREVQGLSQTHPWHSEMLQRCGKHLQSCSIVV